MGKLKPGIQPSTSLLVCKRACCLRWRVESPVCHIHDVFPRDTQHTAPWQYDIYRPPTSFHPLLHSAQPLLPSSPLCSTSRIPLSSYSSSSPQPNWAVVGGVGRLPYVSIASRYVEYVYHAEPGLRTLPSLSTLDNSKLIPPNWLAGVPPRDPRMHAIIHARIYTRVFGIVDHVNSVHAARIPTASDYIRERIRGRTFCPFRFGK